jgi:PAS domain S-box-containing protein
MGQITAPLVGSYDGRLVLLSIFIAISASYVALDLGGRVTAARGWVRSAWLAGGAAAMGLGIWTMHFTGMLAFRLPIPVRYDLPTVLLSLLAAVAALSLASRSESGRSEALRAEQLLRESEDRYRDLVEHSTDLICTHNLQGRLLSVNELPAKLLGYSREELLDKPMRDFLLPEARAQFDESLLNIQRDGFVKGLMVVLAKTGEPRIWEYHNTLRTEGVTEPIVRGIAHDVTERKRAEKELRKAQARIESVLNSVADTHILFDQDWHYLYLNEAAVRAIGRPRERILGRTLWEVFPDIVGTELDRHYRRAVDERVSVTFEFYYPTSNTWWENRFYPAPEGLAVFATDITERKRADAAIRQEQDRAQRYLDIVDVIMLALDLEGRITLINRKGCSTLGREEHELLGRDWFATCLPARTRDMLRVTFHNVLGGDLSYVENPVLTKSGEERMIAWRNTLLRDDEGRVTGTLSSGEDITERKLAEEKLRSLSGKLLRFQDEERRKIARDLHDSTGQDLVVLATMLGQLRGSMPSTGRKSRQLFSECKALADKCLREVRTLSYELHSPVLEDAGLEDAIRDYVKGFTKRSGIQVELELSPRVGRMPRNVELALFRVVQEALTNIRRHSGSQRANIRIHRNSDLTLEISDLGRGLCAPKDIGKEEARLEVGVGIPSMQERVRLIGGRLEIDSNNHGTTVRVSIPLERNEREKAAHSGS